MIKKKLFRLFFLLVVIWSVAQVAPSQALSKPDSQTTPTVKSQKGGTLKFSVSNAPQGARGSVVVKSKNSTSYKAQFRFSSAVKNLPPGNYTVIFPSLYTASGKWSPTPASRTLKISSKKTSIAPTRYKKVATSGTLIVSFIGTPKGKKIKGVLTGPSGFKKLLQKTTKLTNLRPGQYRISGTSIALPNGTTAVAMASDANPIVVGGETSRVSLGWTTRQATNLVTPASTSITAQNTNLGTGSISVTDPSTYTVGTPVLIPATATTPQGISIVRAINGNTILVEKGSIYDALPAIDFTYKASLPSNVDPNSITLSGVSAKGGRDFKAFGKSMRITWSGDPSIDCETFIVDFEPVLKIQEASFKWDLLSRDVLEGPQKVKTVLRAGITKKISFQSGNSVTGNCKASVEDSIPAFQIGAITFWIRGEIGIEIGYEAHSTTGGTVTAQDSYFVDFGAEYTQKSGLNHIWKRDAISDTNGDGLSNWKNDSYLDLKGGLNLQLSISPFESEKRVEKFGFEASADLQVGLEGTVGFGARVSPTTGVAASNGYLNFHTQPFWYASSRIFFKTEAAAKIFGGGAKFFIDKSPKKFINKNFEKIGEGRYWSFPFVGPYTPATSQNPNSTTSTTTPTSLMPANIAAGFTHTCALMSGAARCWGSNQYGQLGNGTTVSSNTPVQVAGLTSGVTAITTSILTDTRERYGHACAVVSGAAKCWGSNQYGQLGNGTTVSSNTPVQVAGLTSGVTAITAGASHTCAVVSGAAKCWGVNGTEQLGNGTAVSSNTPVQVAGLTSGVTAITAGASHTCAVVSGAAKCWGMNARGGLGTGTAVSSNTPVQVAGLTSGVTAITAGYFHTCAVVSGAAKCWGDSQNGQLGTGARTGSYTSVQVAGLTSGVTAITAGYTHTCAVVLGAAKCWGINSMGTLGTGNGVPSFTPVQVTDLTSGVTAITAGYEHTCAVVSGTGRCWGNNQYGQLGNGTNLLSLIAVKVRS
jgi:alpha-tubulin suppressor-like RCC1 family protein